MRGRPLNSLLFVAQLFCSWRVLWRFAATARGQHITPTKELTSDERVSVILPVLNEQARLGYCLDTVIAQGHEVREILVIDGGSEDATVEIIRQYAVRDSRVRLVEAAPVPSDWNGKAWGLQRGYEHVDPASMWILTLDADVHATPFLTRSLLAHAQRMDVDAFSVATRQDVSGLVAGMLHPALLTTLVYRFGLPGVQSRTMSTVQANGQCFFVRRDLLAQISGFSMTRVSRCEDVTLARCIVNQGHPVGFYEGGDLVSVEMYSGWRETLQNWPRSLPMRDQYTPFISLLGLLEVMLVQVLPLAHVLGVLAKRSHSSAGAIVSLNRLLLASRIGVLIGMRRAYRRVSWTYWLSPLCDLSASLALWNGVLRRRHVWRGRVLV